MIKSEFYLRKLPNDLTRVFVDVVEDACSTRLRHN